MFLIPMGFRSSWSDHSLKKAYLITDKCVMAIPGVSSGRGLTGLGAYYLWGLGGRKMELAMKDIRNLPI